MEHMLQYAYVSDAIVYHTEHLADDEIRERVADRLMGRAYGQIAVMRYNRCPECQVWTTIKGKLRPEVKCPAVQEALGKE